MRRSLTRICVLTLGFVLVFTVMIEPGLLALPITLAAGWIPAASRLFKACQANGTSLVLFALAVVLLVGCSHVFLRWLYNRLQMTGPDALPCEWQWKWTFWGFGIIFCTLLSIASLVLMTHQCYWISKSSDPLFIDPYRGRFVMRNTITTLQITAEESQWDSVKIREAFCKEGPVAAGQLPSEAIHAIWVEADEHRLLAIILIPRRPLLRSRASITIIQPGGKLVTRKLDELPQVLASFGLADMRSQEASALLP